MRPAILLALLLLATGAVGAMSAASPPSERLATHARGAELLDAGRNAAAARFFLPRFQAHPEHLELAEALVEICRRECWQDSCDFWSERGLGGADAVARQSLEPFFAAARHRRQGRQALAAEALRLTASLRLQAGDTLSAAVCLQNASQTLLAARRSQDALTVCAEAGSLLVGLSGAPRRLHWNEILKADAWNLQDRLAPADSLYRELLVLAESRGYRSQRAACLKGLGLLAGKRRHSEGAVDLYLAALAEERVLGAREQIALLLNNLGQTETQRGNLPLALTHLSEARELALACGFDYLLGYISYGLGAIAESEGKRAESLARFREALASHRREGLLWGELAARQRLAYNLGIAGEYGEAIEHYEICLAVYEEEGLLYGLNWILSGLALVNHNLGYLQRAEEYYGRAIEVNRQLEDRRSVALCLASQGQVSSLRGHYREALQRHHAAMSIYEELGDRAGVGNVHNGLAAVYFHLGDISESSRHYEAAMEIGEQIRDKQLLFEAANGLALTHSAASRRQEALVFYERALAFSREWDDRLGVIRILNNLSELLIELDRVAEARLHLEEAASLLADAGQFQERALTYINLSRTLASPQASGELLERALESAREGGLPEQEWQILSELGERRLASGDEGGSRRLQLSAIEVVESLRRNVGSDELRRHMLRPAIVPYERMVALILAGGGGKEAALEAFAFTERSRAQILANQLRAAFTGLEENSQASETPQERELLARIAYLQGRLQDGSLSAVARGELKAEIGERERDFGRLRIRIAGQRPDYWSAAYPEVEDPEILLATLSPGERLLVFFLGAKESYLFSGDSAGLRVHRLPARDEIEELVRLYLRMLGNEIAGRAGPAAPLPDAVLHAAQRELFRTLIEPAAGSFRAGETLVILPDGLLHRLPFASLRGEEGYLVEEHALFLAPSLRTLHLLRRRAESRRAGSRQPTHDILCIGSEGADPRGGRGAQRVHPFANKAIEPLPRAAAEAEAIAALYPRSRLLVADRATERRFKGGPLMEARILHIASHSFIDNEDSRRSFIVLNAGTEETGDSLTVPEDDLLMWQEVAGLELRADLVTLSACKSAGGELAYGEGISGLTQAFLYAGADAVQASLMDVPDRFASRMMLQFYEQLRVGGSPAAALRAAQLGAMDASVALWSGFMILGDGGADLAPASRSLPAGWLLALGAIVLIGSLLLLRRSRLRRPDRSAKLQ